MRERQEIEQYFFSEETLADLANLALSFDNPLCLCTPSLGAELERRNIKTTTLDLDDRFTHLRDFHPYDLSNPRPLGERFGVIICDPPFLTISLPQLFEAIRVLSLYDYNQPLIINYLASRSQQLLKQFAPFGLETTGYAPRYATIQNVGRNRMEMFGNLGDSYRVGSISKI